MALPDDMVVSDDMTVLRFDTATLLAVERNFLHFCVRTVARTYSLCLVLLGQIILVCLIPTSVFSSLLPGLTNGSPPQVFGPDCLSVCHLRLLPHVPSHHSPKRSVSNVCILMQPPVGSLLSLGTNVCPSVAVHPSSRSVALLLEASLLITDRAATEEAKMDLFGTRRSSAICPLPVIKKLKQGTCLLPQFAGENKVSKKLVFGRHESLWGVKWGAGGLQWVRERQQQGAGGLQCVRERQQHDFSRHRFNDAESFANSL